MSDNKKIIFRSEANTLDRKKIIFEATPPGAEHSFVVQTCPDAAQALWQTPPGAVHSSVMQTRPDAAQPPVV
jgi:hypothetical protein